MSVIRVASRYTKSLLDLAIEHGQLDAVHQDMNRLLELAASNSDFKAMLKSPVINADKKLNVLNALFTDAKSPLTATFFKVVAQKGRERVLLDIAKEFHRQYNLHNNIQEAEVVTTFPLDEEMRSSFISLVKEISGKEKVELKEKVDSELIGGFILTVGDKQIDESLSSKLNQLKLQFTQNLYEKKY
jgi:F-type H+-transporting ATPase subunit delta